MDAQAVHAQASLMPCSAAAELMAPELAGHVCAASTARLVNPARGSAASKPSTQLSTGAESLAFLLFIWLQSWEFSPQEDLFDVKW